MEGGGGGGAWPPSEGKKKWSIGKLFRRKKKDSDSDGSCASSDEDSQKSNAKRKKTDKKKRSSVSRPHFDHAVPNDKRSQSVTKFQQKEYFDEGVLSDPSAGFVGYVGRGLPRSPLDQSRFRSKESLDKRGPGSSCGSQDGSLRKGRKGRIKARVEAMRNVKHDSSSDDESQRSNSSSVFKFRSDDSLANHSKEGSVSKRSRSARNDRYIKRLSRDDESQLNKEADLVQKGFSRSEAELLALKQRVLSTPKINGGGNKFDEPDYSEPLKPLDAKRNTAIHPVGHANLAGGQARDGGARRQPGLSASNSSVYSYPAGIINFNARVNDESITYSVPYNVNKQAQLDAPSARPNSRRSASVEQNNYDHENVMVVKLPLGSVPRREHAAPPPPPPRDPQRKVSTPVSYMYDNTRPLSYAFETGGQRYLQKPTNDSMSVNSSQYNSQNIYENSAPVNKATGLSWSKRPISTSEDHIAIQQQYYNPPTAYQGNQQRRPSSVSAEVIRPEVYHRYLARPQLTTNSSAVREPPRRHTQENTNPEFLYYADKTPKSRRPIHIAQSPGSNDPAAKTPVVQTKNASDFWKKMDNQEVQRRRLFGHNRTLSDQSINGVRTQQNLPLNVRNSSGNTDIVFRHKLPNGSISSTSSRTQDNNIKNHPSYMNRNGLTDKPARLGNKENEVICYSNIDIIPMDDVRPKRLSQKYSEEEHSAGRRKSSNLEDALSELEAIYNSLGLGDEDLLDRAERRESAVLAPKTAEALPYSSNENYFRFPSTSDTVSNDMNRRGSLPNRQSSIPDKVHDDMAYRRMNPNERPKSKDVTSISFMLATQDLVDSLTTNKKTDDVDSSEPDVLLDDVVVRNIRQANNYLKIEDPQPPFGIPIGPISPAPNSDYLHAVPDTKRRSRFIPQESPDIVADDLAYRTLRKDSKNPSPVNKENPNCIFNNTSDNTNLSRPSKIFDNHVIKKKRAVRSLSANIFTLIQREIDDALDLYNERSLEKAQSIPDLPEAVLEYGKSGRLPKNFKSSQQLSETPVEVKPKIVVASEVKCKDFQIPHLKLRKEIGVSVKPVEPKKSSSSYEKSTANSLENKAIEDELDTLAQEAKETTAKLDIALEEIQKDKLSKLASSNKLTHNIKPFEIEKKITELKSIPDSSPDVHKITTSEPSKDVSEPSNINEVKASLSSHIAQSSSNIKVKGTIPAHIKEKMEEFSRQKKTDLSDESNNKNVSSVVIVSSIPKNKPFDDKRKESDNTGKHTEDSLIAISNQLKIVGCKLKNNSEKQNIFEEESMKFKYLGNQCEIDLNDNRMSPTFNKIDNTTNQLKSTLVSHSNAKYDFLNSDLKSFSKPRCTSPKILSSQANLETINNMQSFDDLRKGISELLDGIGQVNEKLNLNTTAVQDQKIESKKLVDYSKESSIDESLPEDDKVGESRASPEYNSSEELAMIFNIKDEPKPSCTKSDHKQESHTELSSPRLVKTANQNLRKLSLEENDPKAKGPAPSQVVLPAETSTSVGVPWRRNRRQSSTDNANKGSCDGLSPCKPRTWYHDANMLMLACYSSLICTQELAGLDVLTSLGILLAVIIIIAMLML